MTLESKAQEFFVIEPDDIPTPDGHGMLMESPLEVLEELSEGNVSLPELTEVAEVAEPVDIIIVIDDIPGAPKGTNLPSIVVEEAKDDDEDEDSKDSNSAEVQPKSRWDWSNLDADNFILWVKDRINTIPKHSGYDTAGLERSIAYLEKLDSEISRAMRVDLEERLDANKVEEARNQIDSGILKAKKRVLDIKEWRKNKNKTASANVEELTKEGQKTPSADGVMVTVPLLISSIARTIINGTVSAGHDSSAMYKSLVEKYKLDDREQASLLQLLSDMNFPIYMDRGHLPDENYSRDSQGNFDWAAQYQA